MYAVISLDGYIAQVNGDIDFSEKYIKQYDYGFKDFLRTIDCVLFSHRHYTMIQCYNYRWKYENLPCYVICQTAGAKQRCAERIERSSQYFYTIPFGQRPYGCGQWMLRFDGGVPESCPLLYQ